MEQTLGKRIAMNRKRLGMTQDQVAERLGVTAQAVSKWENDQSCPDISMLPKLGEIFGISTDELLGHQPQQKVYEAEVVDGEEMDEKGIHVQNGKWEFQWNSGKRDALTFAVLVLLVGVLTLISRALNLGVSFWSVLWPSALLVYGLRGIYPRFSFFSIGCSLLGAYFLTSHFGLINQTIGGELLFPIAIVIFGLSLLVDALRKPKKPQFRVSRRGKNGEKTTSSFYEDGEHFDYSIHFGESNQVVHLPKVSSGEAVVSFGELTVDLTQCDEIADGCHVEAGCSFGQLNFRIPKAYQVIVDPSTSFGNTEVLGQPDPQTKGTIFIESRVSFGEISIQYV